MVSSNKARLFVILLLALILSCSSQSRRKDYLRIQNAARHRVGVRPLKWSTTLATYARRYARSRSGDCNLILSGGPYGENLAWGSSDKFSGEDASKLWVSQRQDYDHGSNTCAPGKLCLDYTQVVWRRSTRLGCGRARCKNSDGWFVVCSYNPPGNILGEWPY